MGIDPSIQYTDLLRERTLNVIMVFCWVAFLFIMVRPLFFGQSVPYITVVLLVVTTFIVTLRYYGKFELSYFVLIIIFPLIFFYILLVFGGEGKVEYTFFLFIVGAALLFDRLRVRIILSLYVFVLQALGIYIDATSEPLVDAHFYLSDIILAITLPSLITIAVTIGNTEGRKKAEEQLRLLNEELRKQNEKLQEAIKENETKNRLLHIVAHDLKGPTASFINLTKNLAYIIKNKTSKELFDYALHFEEIGTKIHYTFDNLLNWVIAQKADISLTISTFSIKKCVDDLIIDLTYFTKNKSIIIQNQLPENQAVSTDQNILKIILLNVLHNAVKFSPPNSQIVVTSVQKNDLLIIKVIDEGPGIAPEIMAKIEKREWPGGDFEEGHGLGLQSCFSLADYLNGEITIDSTPGAGTTVCLSLRES